MDRRQFTKMMAAAVAGLMVGSKVLPALAEGDDKSKHACAKANSCKGEGGCKTGDGGCKGKNTCKGKGGCHTVSHDCKGHNDCKGQGGCKTGTEKKCKGQNTCKGKGGCKVPAK